MPPLPAATVLLLRDGEAGLEVLMLERHRDAFFSRALVFPGGRVDAADGAGERAFRVAAIRETHEEVGLLLARRRGETHLIAGPVPDAPSLAALLAAGAIELATDLLVPFAHWVTPERSPKRYDTVFFLAPAPAGQAVRADGREAVEALWLRPADALAAADRSERRLIFATRLNLLRLMQSRTVAAALAAQHRIHRICPEIYETPDGLRIRIPAGLGYELCDMAMGGEVG